MLVQKGEIICFEVSKEMYTIAVKECSAKKDKHLGVSLFDKLVNKLQQWFCLDNNQLTNALVYFFLPLIIYYYFTSSPYSVAFAI